MDLTQKTRKGLSKKAKSEAFHALALGHDPTVTKAPPEPPSPGTHLMEEVLAPENLRRALKRVISNKGSPGVDGMLVDQLSDFLKERWPSIREQLKTGVYRPLPVRRVDIPKASGGSRQLGIPTVLDRLIQQSIAQVLSPILDPTFSNSSYGFRPGRSAHQAVKQARSYIRDGHSTVVDLDLEKFFDRVNHDKLMGRLAKQIKDRRILGLIRGYLNAGIFFDGLTTTFDAGTPQGGPLSPLLSNVVLDELDKELERRGHKFVRYADDCNIYVKSSRAGVRVMSSVSSYLTKTLKLSVNRLKSAVDMPSRRKFLGFTFGKEADQILVSNEALKRFKDKMRELTRPRKGVSIEERILRINIYTQGWFGYFRLSEAPSILRTLDGWIRRRLRSLYLRQWRTPSTRFREFRRLGLTRNDCYFLIRTTKRYWYLSGSQAVNRALSKKFFHAKGLIPFEQMLGLQLNRTA